MTRHAVLQYLGLRRAPGSRSTPADRWWAVAMVIAVVAALFFTRNLDVWPQIGIAVAVAVGIGIGRSSALFTADNRRNAEGRRETPGEHSP